MLRCFLICLLTVWFWLTVGISGTDYCSPTICTLGRPHIGCNNSGDFSTACPENQTEIVPMTPDLIAKILDNHNRKREILASGNLTGFSPAAKMSMMNWDDELAYLCGLNVKTCKFGHDQCHNTDKFKPSGQNLAKMWWRGGSYTDEEIILTRIDNWWLEYKVTNMTQVLAYPRSTENMIGHFTVMTADKNTHVGCSAIKFPENNMSSLTFCCNYATTNFIYMPMYTPGPTASKCLNGTSSVYPSLCL